MNKKFGDDLFEPKKRYNNVLISWDSIRGNCTKKYYLIESWWCKTYKHRLMNLHARLHILYKCYNLWLLFKLGMKKMNKSLSDNQRSFSMLHRDDHHILFGTGTNTQIDIIIWK
jgi:hypothetical protein